MKQPHFLNREKRIFVIHIDYRFWYYQYTDWNSMHPEEQKNRQKEVLGEIMEKLQSNQKTVFIMCPMMDGIPFIKIEQINGKKRGRIYYKRYSVFKRHTN